MSYNFRFTDEDLGRLQARFWTKVEVSQDSSACWNWTGGTITSRGGARRGTISVQNRKVLSYRVAFFLTKGSWPEGVIDHLCSNPLCCNPSHLEDVSNEENMARMATRGRSYAGERHHACTIPDEIVAQIIASVEAGRSAAAVGRSLGIHRTTAWRIAHGLLRASRTTSRH